MTVPNRLEKELLAEHFSGDELGSAVERLESGEPLAYIIGEWYFYGLTFRLNDACLIPRPDTEHVVDKAIELTPFGGKIADLCTGCGCIAVSVLKKRPDLRGIAVDISKMALGCAAFNAEANGISPRILKPGEKLRPPDAPGELNITEADIFKISLPEKSFDSIISNPPYIKSAILPSLDTAKHEPLIALDGGRDGMRFYRFLLSAFRDALKDNGRFIFEIGYDQADDICALAAENGLICRVTTDYGGNDRVATLGFPNGRDD